MWEKWSIRSSNASLQVWTGSSEKSGRRVAGLRTGQHSKENSRDSRRVTWISWMHEGDRRVLNLWESKSLEPCGDGMTVGAPKVRFSLSWARNEAADRARRQAGRPWTVGSNCFDREMTGVKQGPKLLGAGAERMACLRVLKAQWIFDFSSRDSERSPRVAWYTGCAKRVKLGI